MLGVRNKSDTGGLVCAASSSSCMVDLRTFNNNNSTPFSCHQHAGIVRPPTEDKLGHFSFCLLDNTAAEDTLTDVERGELGS